jgi:hypothetical protein
MRSNAQRTSSHFHSGKIVCLFFPDRTKPKTTNNIGGHVTFKEKKKKKKNLGPLVLTFLASYILLPRLFLSLSCVCAWPLGFPNERTKKLCSCKQRSGARLETRTRKKIFLSKNQYNVNFLNIYNSIENKLLII